MRSRRPLATPAPTTTGTGQPLVARRGTLATPVQVRHQPPQVGAAAQ